MATATPQFVDISAFQVNVDWAAYATWARQWDGIARVAIKASEGVGFVDPRFTANRAGALAAGIDVIIYYHFARPDLGNSAAAEAHSMHSVVSNARESDIIVLDYEVASSYATADWAYAWLVTTEQLSGKLAGIYASSAYIAQRLQDPRLAKYPLWLANWQYDPNERPACPVPWKSYEFCQYTDRATNIPGIAGQVDADIFLHGGTLSTMQQYGTNSADFGHWFTGQPDGSWRCSQTGKALLGSNLALFQRLSIDGNTLPVIGLPRTNELYQHDANGYSWSIQFFERGCIIYDPSHIKDSAPGQGDSYLGKTEQFITLDPEYHPPTVTVTKIPDAVIADIKQLSHDAGL